MSHMMLYRAHCQVRVQHSLHTDQGKAVPTQQGALSKRCTVQVVHWDVAVYASIYRHETHLAMVHIGPNYNSCMPLMEDSSLP